MTAVSVIIPIYNMEKYLRECLDSVITQTLKSIEIICINDGSQDESINILKEYSQKDGRIIVIDQSNRGVAAARNVGISLASGEYLCFLDPDDWYPESDILQLLYSKAIKNNVYICGGSFSEYLPNGEIRTKFSGQKAKYHFDVDGLLYYRYYQFDYGFHRFIYKRSFLQKNAIVFPLYSRFQDPPFFVKAMILAEKFYAVSRITYAYRVGHQNVNWTENKLVDLLQGLSDNLRYSKEYRLAELHQTTLRRLAVNYKDMYISMDLDSLPEVVHLLSEFHRNIDTDLLTEDDINSGYHNVILDILGNIHTGLEPMEWTDREQKSNVVPLPVEVIGNDVIRKDEEIKVSVIIPVYNVERYLTECLETIRDQTLREIEIICVNDGATDRSGEIIDLFSKWDERIVHIKKENGGLSSARNAGIQAARGKYIYFIDSDDYLEQNALKEFYEEAEENQLDILYFDAVPFFESDDCRKSNDNYITYYERNAIYEGILKGEDYYAALENNEDFKPSACLQLLRRKFVEEHDLDFYSGIIYEDNLFTIRSMILAKRVKYTASKYYHRRIRNDSLITAPRTAKNIYGYYITVLELVRFINEVSISKDTRNAIIKRIKAIIRFIIYIYEKEENRDLSIFWKNISEENWFDVIIKLPYELAEERNLKKSDWLRRQKGEAEQHVRALETEYKSLEHEFTCMRNSISFRVGRIITCIPRKARTLFRYWKKNGMHEALHLIKEKMLFKK